VPHLVPPGRFYCSWSLFSRNYKILLAPLPRYLWQSCCADLEHGANVSEEGHAEHLLAGTAAVHKLWRGMTFRSKIRNMKITDLGKKIASQDLLDWAGALVC
jgi:hypothetical protein